MLGVIGCLSVNHDPTILVMAAVLGVVAVGAAVVFLDYARQAGNGKICGRWLTLAALTFGSGVWSVHFLAILAMDPGVPMAFDLGMTVASALAAVGGTRIAFATAISCHGAVRALQAGGILSIAVGTMHGLGMLALRVPGTVEISPEYSALSIAAGAVAFAAAMAACIQGKLRFRPDVIGLLVLGVAALHFLGMQATSIVLDGSPLQSSASLAEPTVALVIAAVLVLGVSLCGVLSARSRRMSAAAGEGWILASATAAICIALCGLVANATWTLRHDSWNMARQSARSMRDLIGDDLARTLESLDLSLQAVEQNRAVAGFEALPAHLRRLVLLDRAGSARHLSSIIVLDAQGVVTLDSLPGAPTLGKALSEEEFFTHHRDHEQFGYYVGRPTRSPVTGEWLLPVSRRLNGANGNFDGVVMGSIKMSALRALFERAELGQQGFVTLFREDGVVLMRAPRSEGVVGGSFQASAIQRQIMAAPTGDLIITSPGDQVQVRRMLLYGNVAGTPLYVAVNFAVSEIEEAWLKEALVLGAAALGLVVALAGMSFFLWRALGHRRAAEQSALESRAKALENEALYRLLAENSGDMVSRIGADGTRLYVSPSAERVLGRSPAELIGGSAHEHVLPDDLRLIQAAEAELRTGAQEARVEYRVYHPDGELVWVETTIRATTDPATGTFNGAVTVARDVSARKALETRLETLAQTDGLTGLANRRTFDEAIVAEWRRAQRTRKPLSLLLLDIDRFKQFNDTYGHPEGDVCIRHVASTVLSMSRRQSDLVARYGGEEFAILLPQTSADGATALAEQVRAKIEALGLPHAGSLPLGVVTASIGVATIVLSADDAIQPETLVSAADAALYEAKSGGRNRVAVSKASGMPPACPRQADLAEA